MNLSDLGTDEILNILEYSSNEYLHVDEDSLIERIQHIDPSFQLQDILSYMREKLHVRTLDTYNLYCIFIQYGIDTIEIYDSELKLEIPLINEDMNTQLRNMYLSISICTDADNDYTSLVFPDMSYYNKTMGELLMIYRVLYGRFDALNMMNMYKYMNRSTRSSDIDDAITQYGSSIQGIFPDVTSVSGNRSILHEIHLIDPLYSLYTELERVLELNNLRKRLYQSVYYPIWMQIKDLNWHLCMLEDEITLYVEDGPYLQFPSYIQVDLCSDEEHSHEYTLIFPEGYPLDEIRDLILLNVLHNSCNMTFKSDLLILPQ